MKKILFTFLFAAFCILGFSTASAQYYTSDTYNYGNYTYDNTMYSTSASYSSYSYPSSYSYGNNYSYGGYGGSIGSYTIGCTTYYYNTRTGAQLYTSYICTTYTPPVTPPSYYYTYPTYPSQYCTYGYHGGSWHPCTSYNWYGNNTYNNYLNCYYNQYGQYICY